MNKLSKEYMEFVQTPCKYCSHEFALHVTLVDKDRKRLPNTYCISCFKQCALLARTCGIFSQEDEDYHIEKAMEKLK
jgi:hypothetical protein